MSEDAAAANVLTSYMPIEESERVWLFCDRERRDLAQALAWAAGGVAEVVVVDMSLEPDVGPIRRLLEGSRPGDVLICTFSGEFLVSSPARDLFCAFQGPQGFRGRSAFIRPHIPDNALVQMLCTDVGCAERRAARALALNRAERLRVTAPSGTDVTFEPRGFDVIPLVGADHVFLPPAEVYTGIVPGSAEGVIVADLTVGEFVWQNHCLDPMGVVDSPVCITVRAGEVADVRGGEIADRLGELLSACPSSCSKVVELGIGLSSGRVTGHIGADECLAGTCHFGLGDDRFYGGCNAAGIHLDVLVGSPCYQVLSEEG